MARARDFDVDVALDAAVRSFWARGYAATSVRDLCAAMQIQAGSFYAAFGSKDACFRRALARYLATQPVPHAPSPAAIGQWFAAIVDPARTPRGCLLVHSAMESPLLDPEARALVQVALAAVETFFRRCLGRRRGARADAALLASTVASIHVLARAGVPAPRLRAIARRALDATGLSHVALARS